MITVNIATHKARRKFLKPCIESILNGNTVPDEVHVYFNDYTPPKWFKDLSSTDCKLIAHKAPKGDLGASGKFYNSENQTEGVYLTMDDDLIVEPAYIGYLVDSAYRFPQSIVGLHGTNYRSLPVKSYYSDPGHQSFYCYNGKAETSIVDMLGTGCIAFRAAMETRPILKDFPEKNMTDPYLFKWAKKTETPLVCLIRAAGLVKEQSESQDSAIWKNLLNGDTKQTRAINSVDKNAYNRMKAVKLSQIEVPSKSLGGASIEWGHIKEILSEWQNESGHLLVEFGSGRSTPIFNMIGEVISFEHDEKYVNTPNTIHAPIENGWYSLTEEHKELIAEAKVILIDGPIGILGHRYNFDSSLIPKDCRIFIDDCQREKDKEMAERIAKDLKRKARYIKGTEKIMAVI